MASGCKIWDIPATERTPMRSAFSRCFACNPSGELCFLLIRMKKLRFLKKQCLPQAWMM